VLFAKFPEGADGVVPGVGLCRGGLLGRLVAVGEGTLQLSLGPAGAGLEGGAGVLCRCDLGLERRPQLGLVPRGVLAGLGHLPVSGLADPDCVLFGGGLRRQRLGQPRIGLQRRRVRPRGLGFGVFSAGLEGRAGLLCRCDLGLERRPQLGLVPRGVLADLPRLQVCGHAGTVQLRAGRLRRLPCPGRILLGVPGPGLCAGHRVVPLLLHGGHPLRRVPLGRGGPCLRGRGLLFGGGPPCQRLGQLRIGLQRGQARLRDLSLSPLAALRASAPPEREPRAARLLRPGRLATLPGQHLTLPERGQRRMRLAGHRVRQPAVPRLRRPRPRLILAAGIRAPGDLLSGVGHRQAPFR